MGSTYDNNENSMRLARCELHADLLTVRDDVMTPIGRVYMSDINTMWPFRRYILFPILREEKYVYVILMVHLNNQNFTSKTFYVMGPE